MVKMEKERLDLLLVKRGLTESREKGKALIMAGQVFVNGIKVDKPGTLVGGQETIELKGKPLPYVSRGGLKLEKAIQTFDLNLQGTVMLDVGASTGGFTHCALLHGAKKVYALDVGYGQLSWILRQDPRVICLERKNARHLKEQDIGEPLDVITIDVSFISLEKILPAVEPLLKENGCILALIKPQFEAGREKVGKKGVVREKSVHVAVIKKVIDCGKRLGLIACGLDYSPVTGPEGNIEFLLLLKKNCLDVQGTDGEIAAVVSRAHLELTKNKEETTT